MRNDVLKCNLYLYFLKLQNLLISCENMLMSAELKKCVTWFIYFLDLLYVRCNCPKFHHCRIYVTDFREGAFLATHPWVAPKRSILKRVNSKPVKTNNNANMMLPGLGKSQTHRRKWMNTCKIKKRKDHSKLLVC